MLARPRPPCPPAPAHPAVGSSVERRGAGTPEQNSSHQDGPALKTPKNTPESTRPDCAVPPHPAGLAGRWKGRIKWDGSYCHPQGEPCHRPLTLSAPIDASSSGHQDGRRARREGAWGGAGSEAPGTRRLCCDVLCREGQCTGGSTPREPLRAQLLLPLAALPLPRPVLSFAI